MKNVHNQNLLVFMIDIILYNKVLMPDLQYFCRNDVRKQIISILPKMIDYVCLKFTSMYINIFYIIITKGSLFKDIFIFFLIFTTKRSCQRYFTF